MAISYEAVRDFLYREARYLDDKDWDSWLELYASDASFWMPAWDDNDELVENPQTEISLIWYGNRGGLEDRVFRIRSACSAMTGRRQRASSPRRTWTRRCRTTTRCWTSAAPIWRACCTWLGGRLSSARWASCAALTSCRGPPWRWSPA